ncbi:MAG: DUF885 domain-containing protein [Sphingomonadaceae bacterium]|nr:DUF885 domain-containing protein [Sphingomonadaceae bacterium]
MDRRDFLKSSSLAMGALAGTVALPGVARAAMAAGGSGDAALNARFEAYYQADVAASPELATSLGLDKGALAALKGQLSPRTAEHQAQEAARSELTLGELRRVDRAALSTHAQTNLDVISYQLETRLEPLRQFGRDSAQTPFRIYQQGGAYFRVPDFLNTAHTIANGDDCEAYLSRLDQFGPRLDEETAQLPDDAAKGFLPPDWAFDLTLGQMRRLRSAAPDASNMANSIANRAAAAGIAGDWRARAARIVADKVYPALDRQMAMLGTLRATTRPGDGAWRLDRGEEIYAMALAHATTTRLSPAEVHALGQQQVAEISAALDGILRAQGLTQGNVGARLAALNVRPDQLYANDDAGRAALIDGLNASVAHINALLPRAFATLPTQPLEIRRVPVEIQDGASNGYYNRASLDGTRPAIYFINLKDVGDWPKYSLPALTFHEGSPGHHLQISLSQQSDDIPTLRKIGGFSAYSEGWALYAEQVADQLGAYQNDLERAGYLQSFLFRAARLVVDTGIHHLRWSREQATDYLAATTGFARPRCQREVERYCTKMGQACSYKVGHMTWTRLRAEAEAQLGARFDVKAFHEILHEGAMPLSILEGRVRARTAAMMAA